MLAVPDAFDMSGLDYSDLPLPQRQTLRIAATSNVVNVTRRSARDQMSLEFREGREPNLPNMRTFDLDRRLDDSLQGAPLLDDQGRVRGLVQLGDEATTNRPCMIPTEDWYRRVLIHYAAMQIAGD